MLKTEILISMQSLTDRLWNGSRPAIRHWASIWNRTDRRTDRRVSSGTGTTQSINAILEAVNAHLALLASTHQSTEPDP
jgi:hypothetical protein